MDGFKVTLSWYATTVCALTLSLLLLVYMMFPKQMQAPLNAKYEIYKSLPDTDIFKQEVSLYTEDARPKIIENFFSKYHTPLVQYANNFVEAADTYKLDYRLLPAIAMQESNGAKALPANSFNPFGYGIYGGNILKFSSFEEAINRVAKGLRQDYLDQGLKTPVQIMAKYTPPSLEKGGAWALGVTTFMEELR